jgi:polysaccharide export outer membrane protein
MRISLPALLALSIAVPCVAQTPMPTSDPTLQQRSPQYKIGVDDNLTISFPLSPELNLVVLVQPDGFVNLLNTHPVYVLGLTAVEVQNAIKAAYQNILHEPIIEVDVKDYQKPLFTVLGQVFHPGQFELRRDTTIAEGMAISGGLNPNAKTQVFLMRRVNGGTMLEVHEYNLKKVLQGKPKYVNEQPHLQAGDIIFIPEKFITEFKKYIPYPGIGFNPLAAPTGY